jgi:hypothetical protein
MHRLFLRKLNNLTESKLDSFDIDMGIFIATQTKL